MYLYPLSEKQYVNVSLKFLFFNCFSECFFAYYLHNLMFKGITAVKRNKIRKIRVCLELTWIGKEYSSQWGSLWITSYINTTVSIKHGVSKRVKIRYIFINNTSRKMQWPYPSKIISSRLLHITKHGQKHGKLTDDNRKKAKQISNLVWV